MMYTQYNASFFQMFPKKNKEQRKILLLFFPSHYAVFVIISSCRKILQKSETVT